MLEGGIMISERQVRFNVNLENLGLTKNSNPLYCYQRYFGSGSFTNVTF